MRINKLKRLLLSVTTCCLLSIVSQANAAEDASTREGNITISQLNPAEDQITREGINKPSQANAAGGIGGEAHSRVQIEFHKKIYDETDPSSGKKISERTTDWKFDMDPYISIKGPKIRSLRDYCGC